MTQRIYITGCAKTGTTVLCRLMTAFDLNVFVDDERSIDFLCPGQPYNVVKRNCDSILSAELFSKENLHENGTAKLEWDRQLDYQDWRAIKILHIKRSKREVLLSDNGYVSSARYKAVVHQEELLADRITYTVNYEELMSAPDVVQRNVAAALDLTINPEKIWSEYHHWYQASSVELSNGLYSVRALGAPPKKASESNDGALAN